MDNNIIFKLKQNKYKIYCTKTFKFNMQSTEPSESVRTHWEPATIMKRHARDNDNSTRAMKMDRNNAHEFVLANLWRTHLASI